MTGALSGLDSNLILTVPLAGIVGGGVVGSWWYDRWLRRRRRAAIQDHLRVRDQLHRAQADDGAGRCA